MQNQETLMEKNLLTPTIVDWQALADALAPEKVPFKYQLLRCMKAMLTVVLSLFILISSYFLVQRLIFHDPHPTLFGYSFAHVVTGSMEPTIHVGDMIITERQDDYNEKDIVTYVDGTWSVTHRIIKITENEETHVKTYTTQGDANNTADESIKISSIRGKVIKVIAPIWQYLFIGVLALLFILTFIPTGAKPRGEEEDEEKNNPEEDENIQEV